jgi:hypothetical protein
MRRCGSSAWRAKGDLTRADEACAALDRLRPALAAFVADAPADAPS